MKRITVFSTFNDAEAHVVRSRLETAQLHPSVEHELAGSSAGGFAVSTGGILVQVPEDEVESARALIEAPEPPASEEQTS